MRTRVVHQVGTYWTINKTSRMYAMICYARFVFSGVKAKGMLDCFRESRDASMSLIASHFGRGKVLWIGRAEKRRQSSKAMGEFLATGIVGGAT
jgi:hypothetical protein